MRVLIDASTVPPEGKTGVGYYLMRLVRALAELESPHEFCILVNAWRGEVRARLREQYRRLTAGRFQVIERRLPNRLPRRLLHELWYNHVAPRAANRVQADVTLSPDHYGPARPRVPNVLVVHDLAYLVCPALMDAHLFPDYARRQQAAVSGAAVVITDSEASRAEIRQTYALAAERVVAIPLAADDCFRPVEDATQLVAVRQKYNLPKRYILSVGTRNRRKNFPLLVRGFAMLPEVLRRELALVIAGGPGNDADHLEQTAREVGVRDQLHVLDYVTTADLVGLYSGAAVMAWPSVYEGFGLPILEAMACGAPVVVSNASCLPEVAGGAALKFDPHDPASLSVCLQQVLTNNELASRLREQGRARAACFSWQATAQRTLEVLEQAAS